MKFFSGFSLKNDELFFNEYINSSLYTVSGFSYGAIKALEYTKEQLALKKRIDTLQLFSPAFFQTRSQRFKTLQTNAYLKNSEEYLKSFIKSCFLPHVEKRVEHSLSSVDELEELLNYEYLKFDFFELEKRGVRIEVYIGSEDKIIDVKSARDFFRDVATLTYLQNANHFLQIK